MNRASISSLISKIHKGTPGTGMKDDVPAVIRLAQGGTASPVGAPAALSEGEYVIPADVVSMLGDGNSDAGAKVLDQLCRHVRKQKGKHLAKGNQAPPLA